MTRALDEISRAIGRLEANAESIKHSLDRDRDVAEERHKENTLNLERIGLRVLKLETTVAPVADTVASWKPVIDGVLQSKWKRTGAIGVVAAVGYIVYLVVDKLGGFILSFLHMKP